MPFMKLTLKCKMNDFSVIVEYFLVVLKDISERRMDQPAGLKTLRKRSFKASNSQDAILYNKGS